jgi:hypothetical protein
VFVEREVLGRACEYWFRKGRVVDCVAAEDTHCLRVIPRPGEAAA